MKRHQDLSLQESWNYALPTLYTCSGEGSPLAQASPFSPRRELEQGSSGLCEVSLRRVHSRLGETTSR